MPWPTLRIHQLRQDLDNLRTVVSGYHDSDDVRAALSRFYTIRACGLVEKIVVECSNAYVDSRSDVRTTQYALSWLPWGTTSAHPGSLLEHVGRFDSVWREELEVFLKADDEFLWRELAGLVQKRNRIAHGESEGVSTVKALEYGDIARSVCDWFQARFDPS